MLHGLVLVVLLGVFAMVVSAGTNVTIDDTSSNITYSGTWEEGAGDAYDYGGNHKITYDTSATAVFKFTGTAIYFLSPLWPYEVTTQVVLDDGSATTLDLQDQDVAVTEDGGECALYRAVWGATDLDDTDHTLTMSVASGQSFAIVDGLTYTTGESSGTSGGSTSSSSSSGSSGVNAAAIAVPVVLVIAAIAGVAAFLFWRRRRRQAQAKPVPSADNVEKAVPPSTSPFDGPAVTERESLLAVSVLPPNPSKEAASSPVVGIRSLPTLSGSSNVIPTAAVAATAAAAATFATYKHQSADRVTENSVSAAKPPPVPPHRTPSTRVPPPVPARLSSSSIGHKNSSLEGLAEVAPSTSVSKPPVAPAIAARDANVSIGLNPILTTAHVSEPPQAAAAPIPSEVAKPIALVPVAAISSFEASQTPPTALASVISPTSTTSTSATTAPSSAPSSTNDSSTKPASSRPIVLASLPESTTVSKPTLPSSVATGTKSTSSSPVVAGTEPASTLASTPSAPVPRRHPPPPTPPARKSSRLSKEVTMPKPGKADAAALPPLSPSSSSFFGRLKASKSQPALEPGSSTLPRRRQSMPLASMTSVGPSSAGPSARSPPPTTGPQRRWSRFGNRSTPDAMEDLPSVEDIRRLAFTLVADADTNSGRYPAMRRHYYEPSPTTSATDSTRGGNPA